MRDGGVAVFAVVSLLQCKPRVYYASKRSGVNKEFIKMVLLLSGSQITFYQVLSFCLPACQLAGGLDNVLINLAAGVCDRPYLGIQGERNHIPNFNVQHAGPSWVFMPMFNTCQEARDR